MGIILKGDNEKAIREKLKEFCEASDRRAFGYFLYEIARLPDVRAMEKRLDEIAARRMTISGVSGMKADEPKMKAADIKEMFTEKIKVLESTYITMTAERKNLFNASKWQPPDKKQTATTYLRHLLRKFAAEFITEAGGQK